MSTTAILMMAYGSPGSMADIEPYLLNVRGGRPTPPQGIEKVKARYAAIGGHSPLLEITRAQASALETRLNDISPNGAHRVFVGMRHWHPYIHETVQQIVDAGLTQAVALCLTPYSSPASTQAYWDQLDRALTAVAAPVKVTHVPAWHARPLFIAALAGKIRAALSEASGATAADGKVIFTAHSLPVQAGQASELYAAQVAQTARAVAEQLGLAPERWELCYQSAGAAPGEWLGPSLEAALDRLVQANITQVLVAPIGFVSDHIETLYEIDIQYAEEARALGIANFRRAPALNDSPLFIDCLADLVRKKTFTVQR